MWNAMSLIVLVGTSSPIQFSDPAVKIDAAEVQARQVAGEFLKAVRAKDLDAVVKACGVPWLAPFEEQIINDPPHLKRSWEARLRELDPSRIPDTELSSMAYSEFRKPPAKTGDEDADEFLRAKHDEVVRDLDNVLDQTGWIVTIADKKRSYRRFILVRLRDGRAEVVGGPDGMGYLLNGSRIPRSARAILEKADSFELYSLDPRPPSKPSPDDFHGWTVLGKTAITAARTRDKLVTALKQSAEEADSMYAGCFTPRHGLRVTDAGRTTDFVICFECVMTLVYYNDTTDASFQISDAAQPTFDEVLKAAGVPLAEKGKK